MSRYSTRTFQPCLCKYQKKKNWGYHLWEWVGGKKSWKSHGHGPIDTVNQHITKYARVLVKCQGCGSERLREHKPCKSYT